MSDESTWQEARLIPTSGISGADEQERRATSALLAVMSSVREFGRTLTQPLGAPSGAVETFIEVPFTIEGKKCFPDGLIRVSRGQRVWTALLEVKTGSNRLGAEQLTTYLDVAREHKFDALLTISNEIPPIAGQHPTTIDKRKLKNVTLHHYSWSQVLAEAVMQKEHRGVADPDQAWILGELIRYLEHPRSGALEFEDMGASWVPVREAISTNTLRVGDPGIADVATKFDALLRFAGLRLGRRLGLDVVPQLTRKELGEPAARNVALVQSLVSDGTMVGAIKIPGAVAPVVIRADLRAGRLTCQVDVEAPRDGRPTTRVNWLVRQLRSAPENTRLESSTVRSKAFTAAELLSAVRDDPGKLIHEPDRELRAFRVALDAPLGTKRGKGKGAFIDSVLLLLDDFYGGILQNFKAWTPTPAKLRDEGVIEPVAPRLVSTSLSSQDGPEEPDADAPSDVPSGHDIDPIDAATERAEPRTDHPSRRELRLSRALSAVPSNEREPGWFKDPEDDDQLRWWDGRSWTAHSYRLPQPEPMVDA